MMKTYSVCYENNIYLDYHRYVQYFAGIEKLVRKARASRESDRWEGPNFMG